MKKTISAQLAVHLATLVQEPLKEWEREAALKGWLASAWGKIEKGT